MNVSYRSIQTLPITVFPPSDDAMSRNQYNALLKNETMINQFVRRYIVKGRVPFSDYRNPLHSPQDLSVPSIFVLVPMSSSMISFRMRLMKFSSRTLSVMNCTSVEHAYRYRNWIFYSRPIYPFPGWRNRSLERNRAHSGDAHHWHSGTVYWLLYSNYRFSANPFVSILIRWYSRLDYENAIVETCDLWFPPISSESLYL